MKNIPLKIFILVLIAGIIGIVGVSVLTIDITMLSDTYNEISVEYREALKCTSEIRRLIYKHQTLVAKHVATNETEKFDECEREAKEIEETLKAAFSSLENKMQGGESEQLYHNAHTGFISYISSAKTALTFSRQGQEKTANYYFVNVMDANVNTVNNAFAELDNYANNTIQEMRKKMEGYIHFSRISAIVSIIVIAASVIICSLQCFKTTSNLNKYKNRLEVENESKNKALRERNEKMLKLQDTTIIGMANLIESRDGDTGEHVKRTSVYVAMLAQAAQEAGYEKETLTDAYIELLIKAAPLHDIGKITVSDTILLKPARLTAEEFDKMKTHASEGGRIVRDVIGEFGDETYIQIASDVAAYHHEKWNGTGYNKGLAGKDIPLCARIMAIADVFDALISKRCYKDEIPVDEAFKVIEESAGTHFDPTLAKLFLEIRPQIEAYLATSLN